MSPFRRDFVGAPDLRAMFAGEHARLEAVFTRLQQAFGADARDEVQDLWSELDASLGAHMTLEERVLFPRFAKTAPDEAAELLREHAELRRELLELGVGVDLHLLSSDVATAFLTRLRAHARREDALLYGWATEHVDRGHTIALGDLLRALFSARPTWSPRR